MIRIEWSFDRGFDPGQTARMIMEIAANACAREEGVPEDCFITVRCCGDEAIRAINRTARGIDASTDVLSFPTVRYPAGRTAAQTPGLLRREYDDVMKAAFLGDLVISLPHCRQQALEYRHSFYREAAYLLVHGVFHLMGYDHIREDDQRIMRQMEEKAMQSIVLDRAEETSISDEMLIRLAREVRVNSYSPYSRYAVGAALLGKSGKVYLGVNVENASFGLSNCAERTALFRAVCDGEQSFQTIAIVGNTEAWPCGACRQALYEFAPDLRILVGAAEGPWKESTLSALLPEGFGPDSMAEAERRESHG